ncbi:hypothetical protein [Psittacicella hinzii]|uniref:Uncharacterized protein n=1 Tax=Psittacicella hinzii TaxID=2028575 RepID=A0A3A1YF67_9GAMM|nr:hypothetical protein [Psittacicella hinzii]RIY36201.1 hypothetical protein CKF58_06060 [Psittacicella hinzii]
MKVCKNATVNAILNATRALATILDDYGSMIVNAAYMRDKALYGRKFSMDFEVNFYTKNGIVMAEVDETQGEEILNILDRLEFEDFPTTNYVYHDTELLEDLIHDFKTIAKQFPEVKVLLKGTKFKFIEWQTFAVYVLNSLHLYRYVSDLFEYELQGWDIKFTHVEHEADLLNKIKERLIPYDFWDHDEEEDGEFKFAHGETPAIIKLGFYKERIPYARGYGRELARDTDNFPHFNATEWYAYQVRLNGGKEW